MGKTAAHALAQTGYTGSQNDWNSYSSQSGQYETNNGMIENWSQQKEQQEDAHDHKRNAKARIIDFDFQEVICKKDAEHARENHTVIS